MGWNSAWPSLELQQSRRRLEELKTMVDSLPSEHYDHFGPELARFLTVRAAGYLEDAFETCISCFAEAHSHPAVANYIKDGLFRGRNPRPDALLDRISKLDPEWESSLRNLLQENDSYLSRELSYLVDRRNKIAHGKSESVTIRKSLTLVEVSTEIADHIVNLMDPRG